MKKRISLFTPQTALVYKLLLKEKQPLTVHQLALRLNVAPQGLYRVVKQLQHYGLVIGRGNYPSKYKAIAVSESADTFLLQLRHQLFETLSDSSSSKEKSRGSSEMPDISFIQGRDHSITKSTEDLKLSKTSVDMIVSGGEIPAETILECKRAIMRGVRIRMLTQENEDDNKEMFQNWKRLGIEVRTGNYTGARIFLYDSYVVYIISYDADKKTEALGVRFKHRPIVLIMRQIFGKYWQNAKKI